MSADSSLMTYVDGPPPLAPIYGLLPAAEAPAGGVRILPDADASGFERWGNGVQVWPHPPQTGSVQDPYAVGSDRVKDDGDVVVDLPEFAAFTAYLAVTCKSYKVWNQAEYKARAVEVFMAVESSIVAKEFMGGIEMPSNPHLADGGNVFPNGDTVTSALNGLSLLEKEIGLTGRQGVVHCSPQLATTLRERLAIDNKTGVIRTINGTVIIPDFGYATGAHPTGHPAASGTQEWMYATGPIDIRRSEVMVMPDRVDQALDRGTPGSASMGKGNTITYRVERYYLVDWDTVLQAAVRVDRCQTTC